MNRYRTLGFLLKDVSRLYTKRFEERARCLSLTLPQCKVLLYLDGHEGVSQKRLAEIVEMEPMSLVRVLDRMEADGWVQRRRDPQDRRARCLCLTARGRPIIEQIWLLVSETRAEVLDGFTNEEHNQLKQLLERAHANLSLLEPLRTRPVDAEDESEGTTRRTGS